MKPRSSSSHAGAVGQQILRVGPAADGDDELVDGAASARPWRRCTSRRPRRPSTLRAGHLRAEPDVETLLLEVAQRLPSRAAGRRSAGSARQRLEHRRLRCPRRRQTLPSSRPMTPAPMTPSRFGTASNSSAPQESTMCLPSNGTLLQLDRRRAGGEHDVLGASSSRRVPSCAVNSTLLPGQQLAVTLQRRDAGGLEQRQRCRCVMVLTMPALRFCICARSSVTPPTLMPCTANSSCAR